MAPTWHQLAGWENALCDGVPDPGLGQRHELDERLLHDHRTGGIQTLNVSGSGRDVRMNGTARVTGYGCSLWEFGVHVTRTTTTLPPVTTPAHGCTTTPFYIILNNAVGGDWPGSPDATTVLPQNMLVDYVRVYQN